MTITQKEDHSVPSSLPPKGKRKKPDDPKKHRAFHSAKDYETSASQIGDIEPLAADIKSKAQRQTAEFATRKFKTAKKQAEVTKELMLILGIHPSQPDFIDGPQTNPANDFNAGGR